MQIKNKIKVLPFDNTVRPEMVTEKHIFRIKCKKNINKFPSSNSFVCYQTLKYNSNNFFVSLMFTIRRAIMVRSDKIYVNIIK